MRFIICARPQGVYPATIPVADFSHEAARQLVKMGHKVMMLFTTRDPNLEEQQWLSEAGLLWCTWVTGRRPVKIKDLFSLLKIIKAFQPDYIECHFSTVAWGLIGGFITDIPHRVAWYHTTYQAREHKSILSDLRVLRASFYRRLATAHVTNSQFMKQEYIKLFHIPPQEIRVQHLGVHLPQIESPSPIRLKNRIVCVSGLKPAKGQSTIIRALPSLLQDFPDIKVIFAGSGDPSHLIALSQRLQVETHCEFVGSVPRNKVYELFLSATIAVVPTLAEGFGLVAIEALSCGAPLIASATGGLLDIIEDNVSGLLVPPGDVDSWIHAMKRLLKDDDLRSLLSAKGYKRASIFSIRQQAKAYAHWLVSLTSKGPKGA